MNDEEWRKLHENFETTWLLDAVGHVDELRGYLNDGEYGRPPEIRDDLLKLHGMAMDVVNNGWDTDLKKMAELAVGIEDEILDMTHHMDALHQILTKLTELLPESAFDSDEEE
jgi:hypothetical protein